jgi:hypothetical protein
MLRRVTLARTDLSEELSASIVRVTRMCELGTLAVTSNRLRLLVTSNVVPSFSETSVLTRATLRNIPGDSILHSHGRENLKSYTIFTPFASRFITCFPVVSE